MPGKSDALSDDVLDATVGGVALSQPTNLYFALFTVLPADDGTGGTEVTGGSYARKLVTNNLTEFPAASGQSKNNANDVTFVTATANWGTVVGVGVFDALTVGVLRHLNVVTVSKSVENGDTARFPAGTLVWTED